MSRFQIILQGIQAYQGFLDEKNQLKGIVLVAASLSLQCAATGECWVCSHSSTLAS